MIPSKKLNLAFAIAGLCAAGGGAQLVSAETGALVPEEVVVTASKRGEVSAQETALSISVASDDLIIKSGMVGMDDFLRTVPSVNFLDRGNVAVSVASPSEIVYVKLSVSVSLASRASAAG